MLAYHQELALTASLPIFLSLNKGPDMPLRDVRTKKQSAREVQLSSGPQNPIPSDVPKQSALQLLRVLHVNPSQIGAEH
jgi:hypothetical protein